MRSRSVKHLISHTTVAACSLIIAIIVIGLLWWDTAQQPALPSTFSYSADTVTSETYFTSSANKPQPSLYTQTNFEQSLTQINDRPALRTTIGTLSHNADRHITYSSSTPVNTTEGTYADTPQYVMAPRGITKGEGFTHRHPTITTPMHMAFQRAETISNLELYVYKAEVSDITTPSSLKKDHVIPEGQTLQTISQLETWVEPLSGWIVKSEVERSSNLVDTRTKEHISHYSHITESMANESTARHLTHAKELRIKHAFAWQVAPGILFGLFLSGALILFIAKMRKRSLSVYGTAAAVMEISGLILVGWLVGAPVLVTFLSGYPAINPLVAVWFIAVALAIISLYKEKRLLAAAAGCFIAVTSITQLLGALHILPFSLDLIVFRDAITTMSHTVSGSIPLFTSFMFLLLGISLIKSGFNSPASRVHFAQFLVSIVCVFGVFGIILKITLLDSLLINFTQPFPLVQSLLFVICSYILVQQFRKLNGQPHSVTDTVQTLKRPFLAALPVVLIIAGAQLAVNDANNKIAAQFQLTASSFEKGLTEKNESYTHLLSNIRGLFSASQIVTTSEFQQFTNAALPRDSSIVAIGYAPAVSASSAPITHITSDKPSKYTGYDLFSDPSLSSVLEYARDYNRPVMSPPSRSFGNTFSVNSQGVIVLPIYQNNSTITSISHRRASLIGYTFVVIDTSYLLETLANKLDGINVVVYDGINKGVGTMLYTKKSHEAVHELALAHTATLFSAGRPWTVHYSAQSTFASNPQQTIAALILLGGSSTYFAILALFFLLRQARQSRNNGHAAG